MRLKGDPPSLLSSLPLLLNSPPHSFLLPPLLSSPFFYDTNLTISLRVALQQATGERDEAQSELERLRMKVTSLEDEHHFLQSDFSAKSADMLDKFSAQVFPPTFLLPLFNGVNTDL